MLHFVVEPTNAYITKKIPREIWLQSISALPGLNGLDSQLDASAQYDDPTIAKEYEDFERNRNYKPYGKQLRQ